MLCHDSTFCIYGPLWEKSIGHQCHKGRAWHIQKISLAPLPELCIFQSAHIEYKRKLCSNPLAQLVIFLTPGNQAIGYVNSWKDQQCQVEMFPWLIAWTSCWTNSWVVSDSRHHGTHVKDVPMMTLLELMDQFFLTYTMTFLIQSYLLTISSILTQQLFDLPYTVIDCQTELTSPGTLLQGSNYSWYMLPWQQADIISLLFIQIILLI